MATPRFTVDRQNLGKIGVNQPNVELIAQLADFAAQQTALNEAEEAIEGAQGDITTLQASVTALETEVDELPLRIPVPIDPENATTTQPGLVELATSAETATGTDTTRAVTPAGAAATYTPTTALAELIRDTIGTALVAGSNVTITVNDGADTITIASSGGGGGGGSLELIEEQTPSGVTTVTFTAIAATWRDLLIVVRARSSTAAVSATVSVQFNNDTAANYDRQRLGGNNGSTAASAAVAQTSIPIGTCPAGTATANHAGAIDCTVYNYRGTTFEKVTLSHEGYGTTNTAAGQFVDVFYGAWRSTSAITEIDVILSAGNYDAGSVVSLYGRM
jgi:hypothetical protein